MISTQRYFLLIGIKEIHSWCLLDVNGDIFHIIHIKNEIHCKIAKNDIVIVFTTDCKIFWDKSNQCLYSASFLFEWSLLVTSFFFVQEILA